MAFGRKSPGDIAQSLSQKSQRYQRMRDHNDQPSTWRRDTFTLPRDAAREKAREWFKRFPKAAYMTEVEKWRELTDGQIEFTMRRLPTAD